MNCRDLPRLLCSSSHFVMKPGAQGNEVALECAYGIRVP